MMKTNADKITDFHLAIGSPVPDEPTMPSADTMRLRRTLIREEYEEVMEAFDGLLKSDINIVPLMHELADLLYVVYGTYIQFGVDADAVFDEVHRANMQKANGPRREDGKVLKPDDFVPADVTRVIAKMQKS